MGHKLSATDKVANERTPPKRKSLYQIALSKLSSGKKGKGSPKSSETHKENVNVNENPANGTELESHTPIETHNKSPKITCK